MSKKTKGTITLLDGFPNDVVAAEFHGNVDSEQFEKVLKPAVVSRIAQEGKVKLFYVLGDDFGKLSSGFALDDAGFALRHMHKVARIAIVTDKKWLRRSARLFSHLVSPEVQVFRLKDMEAARTWITDNTPPRAPVTEAEIEAERTMEEVEETILPIEQ